MSSLELLTGELVESKRAALLKSPTPVQMTTQEHCFVGVLPSVYFPSPIYSSTSPPRPCAAEERRHEGQLGANSGEGLVMLGQENKGLIQILEK